MRFVSVTAVAFGALADRTLRLREGLNVIVGPNDSGKSTWHAAMYAALCGLPPERLRTESERFFQRQRQPRRLPGWCVEAEFEFDERRRLEVRQDLLSPETATATFLDGPSVPLAYEGGLDVTRLLGLNRHSYAATAWVPQDRTRPTDEQSAAEELRRVVSTYVGDRSVEAACERLRDYRLYQIGAESDAYRPLGYAVGQVTRAQQERDRLLSLEQDRIQAEQAATRARADLVEAQKRLRIAEAAVARKRAADVEASVHQHEAEVRLRQSELDELQGVIAAANRMSATVVKFPGYVVPDDPAEITMVPAGRRSSEVDPLGVLPPTSVRSVRSPLPYESSAPYENPAPYANPWAKTDERYIDNEPAPVESTPPAGRHERRPKLGVVEGVVFPAVFVGGLVLAAVFGILALTLQTVVGVVLAVLAVLAALAGIGLRVAMIRRGRRRSAERAAKAQHAPTPEPELDTSEIFLKPVEPVENHNEFELDVEEELPPPPAVDPVELRLAEQRLADAQERLRRMREEQQAAERERERRSQGISEYDLLPLWNQSHDEALRGREQAQDGGARAGRAAQEAEDRLATAVRLMPGPAAFAEAEAALVAARQEAGRLRKQDRLIQETVEHLVAARAAAHGKIAEGVETRLREYLPEVTDNLHHLVDVDDELRVRVGDPSQPMTNPTPASRGTVEQTHLLKLIALGRHLGYGHELGPLLLDDVTSNADPSRMRRLMALLHRIAQQRQVIVFAHEASVAKWASKRAPNDRRVHLHRLNQLR